METQQQAHPSQRQLAALALGKLAEPARVHLSSHVSNCATCSKFISDTPRDRLAEILRSGTLATRASDQSTPGVRDRSTLTGMPRAANPAAPDPPRRPQTSQLPGSAQTGSASEKELAAEDIPQALRQQSKYRLIRLLGRGGMGSVYEADHEMMDRRVALKIINAALVDHPEALQRFDQEVKAAAKLDHPNVARAYDADQFDSVRVLVMEYVPGLSLDRFLAGRGRLTVIEACRLVRQAFVGLEHAHQRGMVHRDLKPQNLMLTPDGKVKILDFGLAKIASEQQNRQGLTRDNAMMGTPHYLAPEQALDAAKADIRADIYSLGCTLYCLLSGAPPFTGDTEMKVLLAHQNEPPRPLCEVCSDVPRALSELVDRMLAKDPADRPQTPREAADALLPYAKGQADVPVARPADPLSFLDTEADKAATPAPGQTVIAKPATQASGVWIWSGVAAATLLGLVLGAWALGVFTVRTPEGTIIVENLPADVDVQVDGASVTLSRAGDMVTISAVQQGDHHLKFVRDGKEIWTSDAKIDFGGQEAHIKFVGLVAEPKRQALPQLPDAPPTGSLAEPRRVNLLRFVHLDRDVIEGKWSFNQDSSALTCQPPEARIDIPYSPPAEYDLVIKFVRLKQDDPPGGVSMIGCAENRQFHWGFDWGENHGAGINLVHGKNTTVPGANPTGVRRPQGWITVGKQHTMTCKVRNDRIQTYWDGELVVNYQTDFRDISLWKPHKHKNTLGLGASGLTEFQSVELFEVTGRGTPLWSTDVADAATSTDRAWSQANSPEAEILDGTWVTQGDELVQTAPYERLLFVAFGNPAWSRYDLTLEAKATTGQNGFDVYFNFQDRDHFRGFSLGAWRNTGENLFSTFDGKTEFLQFQKESIAHDTWHQVTIKVRDGECHCSIDGRMLFDKSDSRLTRGRVGIGSWGTEAHFRNIKVTAEDGKTILWEGLPKLPGETPRHAKVSSAVPAAAGAAKTTQPLLPVDSWSQERFPEAEIKGGKWTIEGDELVQHSTGGDLAQLVFGYPAWSHYTLSLKAKSGRGNNGFSIYPHFQDSANYRECNLGGRRNRAHFWDSLFQGKYDQYVEKPGAIEKDRWYDVRIEVQGALCRCFLDGAFLLEQTDDRLTSGRIGLGCYETELRFKDVKVTSEDGKTIFWQGLPKLPGEEPPAPTQQSSDNADKLEQISLAEIAGGRWSIEGDELVQSSQAVENSAILFGDRSWSRYNLTFKAKADAGRTGFGVGWNEVSPGNFRILRLGWQGNSRHELSRFTAGNPDDTDMVTRPGSIERNRWYKVRIEVRDTDAKCYLDDSLLFDKPEPRLASGRIGLGGFATAMRFKDIVVTSEDGQKILWQGLPKLPGEQASLPREPAKPAGDKSPPRVDGPWTQKNFPEATFVDETWVIDGIDLVQSSLAKQETCVVFGDPKWSRYNINLKGMAGRGKEGFRVLFNYLDRDNFRVFTVGAWSNTSHDVSSKFQGAWDPDNKRDGRAGRITRNRWHDVRIEVRGNSCRCFLDGQLCCQNTDAHLTHGQIGLGTWSETVARFRDIVVTSEDGKTVLWKGNPALPAPEPQGVDTRAPGKYPVQDAQVVDGPWAIEGNELVQPSLDAREQLVLFGDPEWTAYNLDLKAKAGDGTEGFKIYFNYANADNFRILTWGAWKNVAHDVTSRYDGIWDAEDRKGHEGKLERNQWYDVRLEVRGGACRCLLNGELWFEQTDSRLAKGRIGVGSFGTVAHFKDIVITATDGKTILWEGLPTLHQDQ